MVHVDDLAHGVGVGKADVVEEAAPEKGVGQLLLVVAGDDDDGAGPRPHRLLRLVDEELHAVELQQEVVRELDVGLVDLVDEQHRLPLRRERLPQLAAHDVVGDVVHPGFAELRVAQSGHRVVLVESLLRPGGGLDVPLDERPVEGARHLDREHGLPGARLALDEERAPQRRRGVHRDGEVAGGHVAVRAVEPSVVHHRLRCRVARNGSVGRWRRPARASRHGRAAAAPSEGRYSTQDGSTSGQRSRSHPCNPHPRR